MMTGQESRVVRCGTSGKRHDTDCHHFHPALRVAGAADRCVGRLNRRPPLRFSPPSLRVDLAPAR
ncbi:MAG: hypothetical protein H6875_01205 [Hyphomicrobiaceae bacterium]|nr:hypothetical protein [Hyphomicrobiaceae bacterium]